MDKRHLERLVRHKEPSAVTLKHLTLDVINVVARSNRLLVGAKICTQKGKHEEKRILAHLHHVMTTLITKIGKDGSRKGLPEPPLRQSVQSGI